MARIALKIDVDTLRGTREGVPALVATLAAAQVGASFLFSLGPDHTGRAILRALRPGFLSKVSRTSVVEHYGVRTLLYGIALPGPDIGKREASTLRSVRDAGFEVGVHCWDHVRWQDKLMDQDAAWAEREMGLAVRRFNEVFGAPPQLHCAAGWQFNDGAARAEQTLGIRFASDTRGRCPFIPVDESGKAIGPPQLPTTLPTLDELIGIDGITVDNVHQTLLDMTAQSDQDQVYTLHAELEGMKLLPVFKRLLAGWHSQGHSLVSLGSLFQQLQTDRLPHARVHQGQVPGRSGTLAIQAEAFA